MHTSVKLETPVEFINVTPLNSLISKCQIKVCYVGEKPNRNGSVITKEVAKKMANSLPGCPIVGFYNDEKKDFEEHNRIIDISNGNFEIKDVTRPYGFVDLGAKVWFQEFLDDNKDKREYMMTEGWLWTSQYPECQRIIAHSNNQSMELDQDSLDAEWSESDNEEPSFFIINEAMISKLCILGEDNEPCFEGANISTPTIQFSFESGFKEQLFSMMNELKELLNKGGEKVFTRYAVEIGDNVWNALYDFAKDTYSIESVCEEEGNKFAVLASDDKYYRLNFSISEDGNVELGEEVTLMEDYTPEEEPQFNADAVKEYAASREVAENEPSVEVPGTNDNPENNPAQNVENSEKTLENAGKTNKYNLEDIQEYVELSEKYSALETQFNEATSKIETLTAQNSELTKFKADIEKVEKKKMIDSFYMLSDEDKADVVNNIDNYSLDDIEAKLSIICVRNKVSFNLDGDNNSNPSVTFNLNDGVKDDAPAWVKALRSVAKEQEN